MAAREANGPGSALTKPRRPRQLGPLADQDDAGLGAATNLTSGPGAWMSPLTEGEEVTLTPSLEGYLPERLIEYHKRMQRGGTDPIGAVLSSQYSQDANQKAWWIAHYDTPALSDKSPRADALRAGAPLTEYSGDDLDVWGEAAVTAGIDAGRWVVENPDDAAELVWDTAKLIADVPQTPLGVALDLYDVLGPDVGLTPEILSWMVKNTSSYGSPRFGRDGMIIYENCTGSAYEFLDNVDQTAVTIGDTVFAINTLKTLTELEEYYHYLQYQRYKDGLLPTYVTYLLGLGYDNPFEKEAKQFACAEYQNIYGIVHAKCTNMPAPPSNAWDRFRLDGIDPLLDFPGVQVDRAKWAGPKIWNWAEDLLP